MTKLLTRQEAAARVGICLRNLDGRIAAGTGPSVTRIGKRVFFSEAAVETWIAAQTSPSEAAP